MSDPAVLLQLDAVEATYQNAIVALHDVSLTVRRGEIHALLGANGAGKSTTLKAVSNLLPAERGQITAGTIRFDGRDVARTTPAQLVRLGLVQVLEGRRCFPNLSIEANLVTGALGRDASRAETAVDLERVYAIFPRLQERRRVAAGLTSGGEQQMAAIGRALMSRPRLLVLDEPSMGLAPLVVQDIFARLRQLNRLGRGGRAHGRRDDDGCAPRSRRALGGHRLAGTRRAAAGAGRCLPHLFDDEAGDECRRHDAR